MQTPPPTPLPPPDPIPLTLPVKSPPFPAAALPKPIGDMVDAVAVFTQTDPAMAGVTALTALSATACGRAEIEVRAGWREPLTLQTVCVAGPGERKSAVQQAMVRALFQVERDLVDKVMPARIEAATTRHVAEKAAEKAKIEAGRLDGEARHDALSAAISAAAYVEQLTVPPTPRLLADDVTPEAVASLLAEQGGRMAIISAEGGIFDLLAGRYTALPNLDVFLKGHAGDPLRVDRRGRDPEFIERPALAVGIMIQPGVLATIGNSRKFHDRGLLARFLYAIPTSRVGHRLIGAPTVDPDIEAAYNATVKAMAMGMAEWTDPAILIPTPEAQELTLTIEKAVERHLRQSGDFAHLREWGSKFTGAILRIAGLLHLADHAANIGMGIRTPISAHTIERATEIGAYFKAQAVLAFAEMKTDDATRDAVYLLERIRAHGEQRVSARDLQRIAQKFKSKDELEAPVQRLLDHGWLIADEPDKRDGPGRPASPTFTVHPKALTTEMTETSEPAA